MTALLGTDGRLTAVGPPANSFLRAMSIKTPERIELHQAEDPRDVVHRAVACLAQGGLVLLPGDGSYCLAASVLEPAAVARMARLKQVEGLRGMPITLRSAEELPDWFPAISEVGMRLARRCWPGPLLLLADKAGQAPSLLSRLPAASAELLMPREWVALASPSHRVPRDIIDLVAGPLVVSAARASGQAPIAQVDDAPSLDGVDMILDAGRITTTGETSVVRLSGESWELTRSGLLDAAELKRRAGRMILFVCTGNTCRSPMAEALCRLLLAERLGCNLDEVVSRGVTVASAGVAASEGNPAAQHAADVLRERGGCLEDHGSRMISPRLIHQADHIIAMTRGHLDVLLDYFPEAAPRSRLLHPWGEDVEDPIGSDRENYRRTAEAIEDYLKSLLDTLGF